MKPLYAQRKTILFSYKYNLVEFQITLSIPPLSLSLSQSFLFLLLIIIIPSRLDGNLEKVEQQDLPGRASQANP